MKEIEEDPKTQENFGRTNIIRKSCNTESNLQIQYDLKIPMTFSSDLEKNVAETHAEIQEKKALLSNKNLEASQYETSRYAIE